MRKLYIIALPRGETKADADPRFKGVCDRVRGSYAGHVTRLLYYIFENKEGQLQWNRLGEESLSEHADAMAFVLPKSGYYADEEVYPEEAEIITGLHAPVCMDRLRELVHES